MLTNLRVKNLKRLEDADIELGRTVVFVGPNNSGKTTALQALALWEIGLRKWVEKRSAKGTPEKRPGVTINRRDLIAVPVPTANLLWRDLHVRAIHKKNGKPNTTNVRIDILVSGVTSGNCMGLWIRVRLCQSRVVLLPPLAADDCPGSGGSREGTMRSSFSTTSESISSLGTSRNHLTTLSFRGLSQNLVNLALCGEAGFHVRLGHGSTFHPARASYT